MTRHARDDRPPVGRAYAEFRFYAELNDFLPAGRRAVPVPLAFSPGATVKDLIESLGVPHTEIDLIMANGHSVDFAYRVQDGDRISVYPVFEAVDVSPIVRLRPEPLRQPRFVLDAHLGRLVRYLRLAGFDALYRNDVSDDELVRISLDEKRTLLTRDVGLLKRGVLTHAYFVRDARPKEQLLEVLRRFDLFGTLAPFQRCLACNGVLQTVGKDQIAHLLPPRTRLYYHEFQMCPDCHKLYWKGSHYQRLAALLEDVRRTGSDTTRSGKVVSLS